MSTTAMSKTPLRLRHPDYTKSENVPVSEQSETEYEYDGEAETTDGDSTAVEEAAPENYVRNVLSKEKPLPPITWKNVIFNIQVISTLAITLTPLIAIYGGFTTHLQWKTFVWCIVYYFYTGLGITAGYHRLWAHRCYNATLPLQYFLMLGGSGSLEGSIKWWSRGHRAHHRYTDTELDPYCALKGFWYSHILWMVFKPRRRPGFADVSDLAKNPVVQFQHRYYVPLILTMAFIFPCLFAGLFWGDYRGGFFFAGAARLTFVHHSTFCVNSLAHWLGEAPFDDKHTPRDHFITALVTVGEGYHNFHHEFPQDYRNAIKWYQYDPTKWFIATMQFLGLASQLKKFPDNEIQKGKFAMQLKKLSHAGRQITWPKTSNDLPVLTWEEFIEASKTRQLVVISGFIHDVSTFIDEHPGGQAYIKSRLGRDATNAFYGGTYDHSNGANALLAMLRVGCIEGGYEVEALKTYSEVISNLTESGDVGVMGKTSDITTAAQKTTVIKGNPMHKGKDLHSLGYVPSYGHPL